MSGETGMTHCLYSIGRINVVRRNGEVVPIIVEFSVPESELSADEFKKILTELMTLAYEKLDCGIQLEPPTIIEKPVKDRVNH